MSKERIELSLDPETIKLLRTVAIKKYGNLRSVSRLVEDMLKEADQPDTAAIMADREAHIQKLAKDWGPEWQESFWCNTCGAEFYVGYNTAKYCPMCRSDKVAEPPQVPRTFDGHLIDAESPQAKRCHELLEARRKQEKR